MDKMFRICDRERQSKGSIHNPGIWPGMMFLGSGIERIEKGSVASIIIKVRIFFLEDLDVSLHIDFQ